MHISLVFFISIEATIIVAIFGLISYNPKIVTKTTYISVIKFQNRVKII